MNRAVKHGIKIFGCILLVIAVFLTGISIPTSVSTVMVAEAASPVVESAISWAISIANDNSHGYSQSSRWGPDYDCSSFVISAFRNAGVDVGAATYTGNMRVQFTQHGFQWIPWSQIGGTGNLQRGDILLNEQTHTEIYLGNNQNVGAHSNRGYPQTGDQTGTEVSVSGYYYHPWDGVLRYAGNDVCNCSAEYAADYYVSTNSLPLTMRSGHGTGFPVVTSIPKGATVYVSRANGSWAHVQWNGYSGYCSMEYLTKITSKSYNLHVWVSDTKMGDVPSKFVTGKRYYICYELIDESTGKKANETSNINYKATETVRNSSGKVFEHTYDRSDYNWVSVVCDSEDTYTGTVTISGDVGISCGISFDVYADVVPEMKIWAWEGDDSKEVSTIGVGETANCSYLIRDQNTRKNLNDATAFCIKDGGYTVTIKVYNPGGSIVKTQSYENNDCTWFTFLPDKIGTYKVKAEVEGSLCGSCERTIKVEEKEHQYGSWKVTKEADCTQAGIKIRSCSICNKIQTETIPASGHTFEWVTDKPATSTTTGLKHEACSVCGFGRNYNTIIDKAASGQSVLPTVTPTSTKKPEVEVIPTAKPTVMPISTEKPVMIATPTVKPTVVPVSTPEADVMTEPSDTSTPKPIPTEVPKDMQVTPTTSGTPASSIESPVVSPEPTHKPSVSDSKNTSKVGKVQVYSIVGWKKGKVRLSWGRVQGAKGYQIQYSLKKNFSGKKLKYTRKGNAMLKGLKAKRKYYVRIRAYSGTGNRKYGKWSKVYPVKVM